MKQDAGGTRRTARSEDEAHGTPGAPYHFANPSTMSAVTTSKSQSTEGPFQALGILTKNDITADDGHQVLISCAVQIGVYDGFEEADQAVSAWVESAVQEHRQEGEESVFVFRQQRLLRGNWDGPRLFVEGRVWPATMKAEGLYYDVDRTS